MTEAIYQGPLHFRRLRPNRLQKFSPYLQLNKDSYKPLLPILSPETENSFQVDKHWNFSRTVITWVSDRQSMLALPTKKCFPSTTHSLVCKIPAPINRLKSKVRTTAAPKESNTRVSSSGADLEGWFWATRIRMPRSSPASFSCLNTSSPCTHSLNLTHFQDLIHVTKQTCHAERWGTTSSPLRDQ